MACPHLDTKLNLTLAGASPGAGPSIEDEPVGGSAQRSVPFDVLSALPAAGSHVEL